MPDVLPQEKPHDPGTERAHEASRGEGHMPATKQLTRRIEDASKATEQAQNEGRREQAKSPEPKPAG